MIQPKKYEDENWPKGQCAARGLRRFARDMG